MQIIRKFRESVIPAKAGIQMDPRVKPEDDRVDQSSFTLVELLIVIGILAILTAAVVVVLNPAEQLKQARDSQRIQDLVSLDKSLSVLESLDPSISFGTASTVYVSIADATLAGDATSTCTSLGLSALPSGWAYQCVSSANLTLTNGTGWIPVNFQDPYGVVQLARLPLDPKNTTSTNYYTYTPGGSWELNAFLESNKQRSFVANDGGDSYAVYEKGSNKNLLPYSDTGLVGYWDFEEGTGVSAFDRSGTGITATLTNGPTWVVGKVGSYALDLDGTNDWAVNAAASGFPIDNTARTLMVWLKKDNGGTGTYFHIAGYGTISDNDYFGLTISNSTVSCVTPGEVIIDNTYSTTGWNCTDYFITDTDWRHLTVVADGSSHVYFYVNGALMYSGSHTYTTANNVLDIGNKSATTKYFSGLIDDVRIYNRALSGAEIKAIYDATK